ncbi:hypothetical protein FOBRF1_003659 [Fusarium oxysporum]
MSDIGPKLRYAFLDQWYSRTERGRPVTLRLLRTEPPHLTRDGTRYNHGSEVLCFAPPQSNNIVCNFLSVMTLSTSP